MSETEDTPMVMNNNGRKSLLVSCRKSLGTPAHQLSMNLSNRNEPSPRCRVPENDDVAERRERQRERVRELQRNILNSPATPVEKRLSIGSGIAGLTNAQLAEHYTNCMKLSAENKITVKNAFGLHLIDYMADLLKKSDGSTNFQMASCTLDASAKIYSYRVDCVYTDVFKMVGGLGLAEEPKEPASLEESEEPENLDKINKKKKKIKKSCTVEQNLKALNIGKLETGFAADALFLKMSRAFEEGGMNGLLANIATRNDSCELLLEASALYHSDNEPRPPTCFSIPKEDLVPILQLQSNDEVEICPSLVKFSFIDQSSFTDDDDNLSPPKKSNLAFDLNSVPEPIEVSCALSDNDDCIADDQMFHDDRMDDHGNDVFSVPKSHDLEMRDCATAHQHDRVKAVRLESTQDLAQVLAEEPSEYSYFDQNIFRTWAGPNHWRPRMFPQMKLSGISAESTITRKRAKRTAFIFQFQDTKIASKEFLISPKHVLLNKTLKLWDEEKTTLPEDLYYDPKEMFRLFHKDVFMSIISKSQTEVNDDIGEYNYDNANDRENFCPNVMSQYSDDGSHDAADDELFPLMDASDGVTNNSLMMNSGDDNQPMELQAFSGENLVQQPYKVNRIEISYAKTAKKIDVKKLKNSMWKILTVPVDENKENVDDCEPPSKMKNSFNFSKLYNALPNKLSPAMAKNLSIPVAFVCLLHIANEKNLDLQKKEDFTDFFIQQGL